MTILELLKSDILPSARVFIGDYWIFYDESTEKWVVGYQKRYARKPEIEFFDTEENAVDYVKSKVE